MTDKKNLVNIMPKPTPGQTKKKVLKNTYTEVEHLGLCPDVENLINEYIGEPEIILSEETTNRIELLSKFVLTSYYKSLIVWYGDDIYSYVNRLIHEIDRQLDLLKLDIDFEEKRKIVKHIDVNLLDCFSKITYYPLSEKKLVSYYRTTVKNYSCEHEEGKNVPRNVILYLIKLIRENGYEKKEIENELKNYKVYKTGKDCCWSFLRPLACLITLGFSECRSSGDECGCYYNLCCQETYYGVDWRCCRSC